MKITLISIILYFFCMPSQVKAAEGYWLDQYNALFYTVTFRLDAELRQMKEKGSTTLLLHADSLPSLLSMYIAWRAKAVANMDSIAWIQKPSENKLKRAIHLSHFKGIQIDDHYFNKPPIPLEKLKKTLNNKELWCSFQPSQFSHQLASNCDQSDVQIYRYGCNETVEIAWRMGITGDPRIKVAAYDDGSNQGAALIKCIDDELKKVGTRLFVFKWKNQEALISNVLYFIRKHSQA